MQEKLYSSNGNIMYVYIVMKKFTDVEHPLKITEIMELIEKEYGEKISRKTVERNIKVLKEKFNIVIEEIEHKYYMDKEDYEFESYEIRCLVDIINYSRFLDESQAKQLTYKLIHQLNEYDKKSFDSYEKYMKDAKTINKDVFFNIEIIAEAILNKSYIKFDYYKYNLKKQFELRKSFNVFPVTIICEIGQYYLIAAKDKELFYFRLDRIKNISLKDEKFVNISKKQLNDFVESSIGMYGGKKEKVIALLDNSLIDDAIETFGKNVKISQYDKNRFKMETEVSLKGFKNWALRHLEDAEVIHPKALKNDIITVLANALKKLN